MSELMMIIKTTGLQYDDRLRKECCSLRELGQQPIVAVLEYANCPDKGVTEEGIRYRSIRLTTRRLLPHKRGLIVKTLEMYIRFLWNILRVHPRKIWLHNFEMAGLVPLCCIMKKTGFIDWLVWDQHELPPSKVLNNAGLLGIFKTILSACDSIVVANAERQEYLLSFLGRDYGERLHVLENLVDRKFATMPKGTLPKELVQWLNGMKYFLAQGGANPGRHLEELISAIMRLDSVKLIVVGPYQAERFKALQMRWGERLAEKVYFTGLVPQMTLVNYIDNALASIVLYSQDDANSRLCAPNRLYQSLCRGTPVVVGSNPPLANTVQRLGCGVVLSSDGRDVDDICLGLRELLFNREKYKENTEKNRLEMTWESQVETIARIVGN